MALAHNVTLSNETIVMQVIASQKDIGKMLKSGTGCGFLPKMQRLWQQSSSG